MARDVIVSLWVGTFCAYMTASHSGSGSGDALDRSDQKYNVFKIFNNFTNAFIVLTSRTQKRSGKKGYNF